MTKLAARLRRHLGGSHERALSARPARAAAATHRPRLGSEREPVSARLRRLYPEIEGGRQHTLPGITATPSNDKNSPSLLDSNSGVVLEHQVVQTALGGFVRGRVELSADYLHGSLALGSVSELDGEAALLLSGDAMLADFRPERALFFDLETTGLPGRRSSSSIAGEWAHRSHSRRACAGTPLAFLIGTVRVDVRGGAVLDQFLLRQQPDEPAQLAAFNDVLRQVDCLVSFNGRSFDRNILADRMARNRMDPQRILTLPHLDLLHPSRRLYQQALGRCSLDEIERRVLGLQRSSNEVRGAEVPERWRRYLATGDPRLLHAVLDHNILDLLSLLTLGGHLARCVREPGRVLAEPVLLSAAARLLLRRGRAEQAETLLRRVVQGSSDDVVVYGALGVLANHLRKTTRHEEALVLWRRMQSVAGVDDLEPWRAAAIALERRLQRPADAL